MVSEEEISNHYWDCIDGQFNDVSISEINNNISSNEEGSNGYSEKKQVLEEDPDSTVGGRSEGGREIENKGVNDARSWRREVSSQNEDICGHRF